MDRSRHAAYAGAYVVLVEAGDKAAKKIVTVVNGQQMTDVR